MEFALTCVVEPQNECGRVIAKFRQGSIIRVKDLCNDDRLKFQGEDYVFVISHDCDITAEVSKEPYIEVLTLQILNEGALYTTNFTEPLSYQGSAFLKLPKFP